MNLSGRTPGASRPQGTGRPTVPANVNWFVAFRVFFTARFYYPVFTILFLDYGLSLDQFALLNAVWAAVIVGLEVPTGALADVVGRKRLIVAAAVLMVAEMLLLCLAPRGHADLLFAFFLVNRILSGAAEAAASGADEAIAYDSLKNAGLEDRWPRVISKLMRLQSLAYVGAMVIGSAAYDPDCLARLLAFCGVENPPERAFTLRLTPLLTLLSAIAALVCACKLREAPPAEFPKNRLRMVLAAWRAAAAAAAWVFKTPFALLLILTGMVFDGCLRMIVTLISQYYRLIQLPEAAFGLIGAATALLGLSIPALALRMVRRFSAWGNFALMAAAAWTGLFGLTRFVPFYGLAPVPLVFAVMSLNHFCMSHYLNRVTSSENRATVLSLKGLGFNLAYALIGIAYSMAAALAVEGDAAGAASRLVQDEVFRRITGCFPWVFLAGIGALLAAGHRKLR